MGMVCINRQAKFNYEIKEVMVAGLVLQGMEVKGIKDGVGINESYCKVSSCGDVKRGRVIDEVILCNFSIPRYKYATNAFQYDEKRDRKLLLKKSEIKRLIGKMSKNKLFLIPLKLFISDRGWIKIEIGLCTSKNARDRKESIKKRDLDREMCRDIVGIK